MQMPSLLKTRRGLNVSGEELWIRRCFLRYQIYYRAQSRILRHSNCLNSIFVNLDALQNVKFLTVSSSHETPYWNEFRQDVFHDSTISLCTCCDAHTSILSHVVRLLERYRRSMTHIEADIIPKYIVPSVSCAFNLRSCRLKLTSNLQLNKTGLGLRTFLLHTRGLRTLHIEFPPTCMYCTRFDLNALFCQLTFLDLRDLHLQMALATQEYLADLCRQYYPKLESLAIVELHLKSGSWADALSSLRSEFSACTIWVQDLSEGNGWDIITPAPYRDGCTLPELAATYK